MKEVEIFQSLNLALISNAIYTLAIYFLLWVSLRTARLAREGEERSGILPKILVSLFGLGVIYKGLLLGAFLRLNLSSSAKNLEGLAAPKPVFMTGQACSDSFIGPACHPAIHHGPEP